VSNRITTSMVQRNVLADLNAVSEKLVRSQQKASSGKEIRRPSDDPFNASRAMALRQDQAAVAQYQRNVQDARGWQEATEQALSSVTDALQRARDLVVQGASDTLDISGRVSIAAELNQLVEGIKQNGNATYRGAYLFAGADNADAPYRTGVPASDPARDAYAGDLAGYAPGLPGVVREIGPKVSMTINVVGAEVFGSGGADGKLLSVLRSAIAHLEADDGDALRTTDLGKFDESLDMLLEVRARNGARSNRLESALDRLGEVEDAGRKQLSEVEDADIAKTLIELNSQTAAYQAALRTGASIVQSSLLDFLR
jgi:flagellar hook-associated protein 3 FlgL